MARPPNEDRRPEILDATCRVIARVGIPGLYIRHVAEEAGVSRALVSYYFTTRDDLLKAALEFAEQRAITEIAVRMAGASPREDLAIGRITEALLLEFSDTPAVRDNWVVWSELTQAAMFDETMRPSLEHWSRAWDKKVAEEISEGQRRKEIPSAVDAEAAAERLTALVDGLGNRWLLGEMTSARARTLVRDAVQRELA